MVYDTENPAEILLVDYPWVVPSKKTPYQRVKNAKEMFLKGITFPSSATSCAADWFDALDKIGKCCHMWWPNGPFPDSETLRRMLLASVAAFLLFWFWWLGYMFFSLNCRWDVWAKALFAC